MEKSAGNTRAEQVSLEARMLLLLLNLLLPSLCFAQGCRVKEGASELLSVDYYVDSSGTRYFLARQYFCWQLFRRALFTFETTLLKFSNVTIINDCPGTQMRLL